ncbi:MAG: DUF3108 domain-containing protein [Desulfuromonadales bacterium]
MLRIFMALLIAAVPALAAGAIAPAPFSALYAVYYRGIPAGELESTLQPNGPDEFIYETRVKPSPLARAFVSSKAVERSILRIDEKGVRPLFWVSEDGKPGNEKDGALAFAWDKQRVSGIVESEPVDLPAEPELQDRLSVQIAVMTALLRAEKVGEILQVSGEKIRRYSYQPAGAERIRTEAGEFETVLYESTRPGSSRVSRVWHAPALGYIPVRAEQVRDGKVETVMELKQVRRDTSKKADTAAHG